MKKIKCMPTKIEQTEEGYFDVYKQVGIKTKFKKTKPDLIELKSKYKDVAVLGGSPSLPDDLKQIPKDCILISANHHAFKLITPDFMCFLDHPDQRKEDKTFYDLTQNCPVPRISPNIEHTDYYCVNEHPDKRFSDTGRFALWVASYISTGMIYVCGVSLRNTQMMHFHGDTAGWTWSENIDLRFQFWMDLVEEIGSHRIKFITELNTKQGGW